MSSNQKERAAGLIAWSLMSVWMTGAAEAVGDVVDGDEQNIHRLDKVVVSAARVEGDASDVKRSVAVVEKQKIDEMQAQSIAESLKLEPNVSVSGGPRSDNHSVNIRGLEGAKILQTIDGVRQQFESGHRPSYFLVPELVQSVEVSKGPSGSLWGSGAVGGVVAQNTVAAKDVIKTGSDRGGFAKARFNANNDQQTYVAAIAGLEETSDWLLSLYSSDSNDLEMGNDRKLDHSDRRDIGVLAKNEWQFTENQSLGWSYRKSSGDNDVPSNGSANVGTSVPLIERESDSQHAQVDYRYDNTSPLLNARATAFWDQIEMDEQRLSDGRRDGTSKEVFGLSLNNQSTLERVKLLYGIDTYHEQFDVERGGANRPTPPLAESSVLGAFVSATFGFGESFAIETGARYDKFETEAKNLNTEYTDDDISPSVAFIWQANDYVELILRHDRAFRAPSSEELYTTGTHFCMGPGFCNTFVSNPSLEAEKSANSELIGRFTFDNLNQGQLFVEAAVFENRVDNFIEQVVTSPSFGPVMDPGTTTWVNVDEATIQGFELAATYALNNTNVRMAYGQTRGKDDKTGEDLTNIPANKLSLDTSYSWLTQDKVKTGLRASHVASQSHTNYAQNTNNVAYDGYILLDLYASWSPQAVTGLSVDLSVNNLTDRYYRQAWQELYEPGRQVIISSKYAF